MIAEKIKAETGYEVVFIYGIATNKEPWAEIQCGAVYTHGLRRKEADAITASAKQFIAEAIPE